MLREDLLGFRPRFAAEIGGCSVDGLKEEGAELGEAGRDLIGGHL